MLERYEQQIFNEERSSKIYKYFNYFVVKIKYLYLKESVLNLNYPEYALKFIKNYRSYNFLAKHDVSSYHTSLNLCSE